MAKKAFFARQNVWVAFSKDGEVRHAEYIQSSGSNSSKVQFDDGTSSWVLNSIIHLKPTTAYSYLLAMYRRRVLSRKTVVNRELEALCLARHNLDQAEAKFATFKAARDGS